MGVAGPLLEAKGLTKLFRTRRTHLLRQAPVIKAVQDISIGVYPEETLGIVGESGCGKSTFGRLILRLELPTSGEVLFDGEDIYKLSGRRLSRFRRRATIVFQDPYSSLNPSFTIEQVLSEAYKKRDDASGMSRRQLREHMGERLQLVGLAADALRRYPHELSGGQRQRVGVARALCLDPTLIVADEPVSALDVSIQAQVLNLLVDLKARLHLTCIFISHDLRVIRYISDRVAVLYMGRIVELASHDELFARQLHPYTQALLAAVVEHPNDSPKAAAIPRGEPPNPADLPPGCPYHTRCPFAKPICTEVRPDLAEIRTGHWAACHFAAQF